MSVLSRFTGRMPGRTLGELPAGHSRNSPSVVRTTATVALSVMVVAIAITFLLSLAFVGDGKAGRTSFDFGGGLGPCSMRKC